MGGSLGRFPTLPQNRSHVPAIFFQNLAPGVDIALIIGDVPGNVRDIAQKQGKAPFRLNPSPVSLDDCSDRDQEKTGNTGQKRPQQPVAQPSAERTSPDKTVHPTRDDAVDFRLCAPDPAFVLFAKPFQGRVQLLCRMEVSFPELKDKERQMLDLLTQIMHHHVDRVIFIQQCCIAGLLEGLLAHDPVVPGRNGT